MTKYIEYDTASGHIISELKSDNLPAVSDGVSLLELDSNAEIEIGRYIVKDGELRKIYQTNEEKDEQERIKREYAEQVRARVKDMINELGIAILEDDNEEIERLRREYKNLRAYL